MDEVQRPFDSLRPVFGKRADTASTLFDLPMSLLEEQR
jgi:hypothetical protein